jgi:hypothetical protein
MQTVGYVAPSVTPFSPRDPTFRLYTFDRQSHNLTDYQQYYLNLSDANTRKVPKASPVSIFYIHCRIEWVDALCRWRSGRCRIVRVQNTDYRTCQRHHGDALTHPFRYGK